MFYNFSYFIPNTEILSLYIMLNICIIFLCKNVCFFVLNKFPNDGHLV